MYKKTRCIGIALFLVSFFFAAGAALAQGSPPLCTGSGFTIDIGAFLPGGAAIPSNTVASGDTVNYAVKWANTGDPTNCDVSGLTINFYCPGPNGLPNAVADLTIGPLSVPSDGTLDACRSGDGSSFDAQTCVAAAALLCPVSGTSAVAKIDWNGTRLQGDGALFSGDKTITLSVVQCLTAADCDDTLFCTDDACASGVCQHTAHSCAADDNLCTTESCDETASACVSGAPKNCDDSDPCTDDSCATGTGNCSNVFNAELPGCAPSPGRMTGGGSVFTSTNRSSKTEGRVTHGFELHCDSEVGPNNLEVNWGGNHFHMEELLTAVCTDDPAIEPPPPGADFDTYDGTGTGRCNGEPGASITFQFTDAGEPGTGDHATINITGCPGGLSLSVSGFLKKGNHQAHRTN